MCVKLCMEPFYSSIDVYCTLFISGCELSDCLTFEPLPDDDP